ncbi:MAG: pitrilysin family protein [Acidobacteria bacterium]|nr:pitrilysin family protein [Acidobacteriota bacterium]
MTAVDRGRLPVPGAEPAFVFPTATRSRLENGLGIWTVRRDQLPLVSVVVLLPAGAACDPVDEAGLAAITADMLDEGSGDRSAIQMQEALARIGTDLDTEVGSDAVGLSMVLLERFLPGGLQLLADMVCRPRLADADVARVRDLRMNRLRQLRDSPPVTAEAVFAGLLYGTHAYGHLPIGTSASLERIGTSAIASFHDRAYRPSRTTIIAVGAVEHAAFERMVGDTFGAWTCSPPGGSGETGAAQSPMPAADRARLLIVDRPGAAQTELRIGHVAVPRKTPDFHALVLLNAALGGHFMSRINLNLRERKGYTYGARSAFDFRRQAGPFSVQTSVQTGATADSVREVLGELEAIRGPRPVTEDELVLSKSTLTKGYPRSFETTGQVARGLAQLALYDLSDDTFATFGPRVRALSAADVTAAGRAHLDPARIAVVAVGDRARIEDDVRSLGIGDPEIVANVL